MKGIVSLVGSDIQPFYQPPNADETDCLNAGWARYDVTGVFVPPPHALLHGTSIRVSTVWFSPWDTQLSAPPAGGFFNYNPGNINLNGVLDFQVNMDYANNAGFQLAGCIQRVEFQLDHVFVTCGSGTGTYPFACTYSTKSENFSSIIQEQQAGETCFTFESNPRTYQQSFIVQTYQRKGGMYLGTSITVSLHNDSTVDASFPTMQQLTSYTIGVRARNIYSQGELGPTRVVRWDGMSDGQQIKVDGCINAQCIPEGTIAPFVQGAAMYSDTAHNLNAITFLAELYNGDSPFRRNWTGESYDDFMRTIFPSLSMKQVVGWQQPKLTGIAASGFWDEFKSGFEMPFKYVGDIGADLLESRGGQAGVGLGLAALQAGSGGMISAGQFGARPGPYGKGQFGGAGKVRKSKKGKGTPKRARTPKKKPSAKKRSTSKSSRRSSSSKRSSRASSTGSYSAASKRSKKSKIPRRASLAWMKRR